MRREACDRGQREQGARCAVGGRRVTEDRGSKVPAVLWARGGGGIPVLSHVFDENSMDCIAHGVTKDWTRLSTFHFTWS